MKKILTYVLFLFSTLPSIALAAPATYNLLAPVGTLPGTVTLTQYVKGVFETAVGITGVLAVIMIVVCGIRLMGSGSAGGKSEAKQCIWNAVFGILLAIGSYLLLNTINPLLLNNDAQLTVNQAVTPAPPAPAASVAPIPRAPGWYFRYKDPTGSTVNSPRVNTAEACLEMQKVEKANGTIVTDECFEISKPAFGAPPPAPPATIPPPTESAGEKATRNALCGNDSCVGSKPLGINHNACIGSQTSGCTNVAGLPGGTVTFLKNLPGLCSCDVVITGATEDGHASHGPSIPVFDLSSTKTLFDFIKTNATVKANPSFCSSNSVTRTGHCYSKWLYMGYWFSDENTQPPHWHVCKDGTVNPPGKSATLFKYACTQI